MSFPVRFLQPLRGVQFALSLACLCLLASTASAVHAQLVFAGAESTVPVSGLALPFAVAVDAAGNLFVADSNNHRVLRVAANGGAVSEVGAGFAFPTGVAVDPSGNVFVLDFGENTIFEIPAGGGVQTPVLSGVQISPGLAIDAAGNLYVAEPTLSRVLSIPAGGGAPVVAATGLPSPVGVAVDAAGDLFVAESGAGNVVEVPAGGGTPVTLNFAGVSNISAVAADPAGDVFVLDVSGNKLLELPAGGGAQVTLLGGFNSPEGLAADASGNIFIADTLNQEIVQFQTRAVDFGAVNVCPAGQSVPAPCSRTLTLDYSVTANDDVLSISVLTGGLASPDFSVASGSSCLGSLTAGSGCSVNVTFKPVASGLRAGSLQMPDVFSNLAALTPLTGLGIGAQIGFIPAGQITVAQGSSIEPVSVAVDALGNAYMVDAAHGQVVEFPVGGGASKVVLSGLSNPAGIAVDAAEDIFVATSGGVVDLPGGGGSAGVLNGGMSSPSSVAVDKAGDLYIAYPNYSEVVKLPASGGAAVTVATTGLLSPNAVAVDQFGDLFITDTLLHAVVEIPAGGGAQVTLASGFNSPNAVAVDVAGDVFVVDVSGSRVVEIPAGGGASFPIGAGLFFPSGVAVDSFGNVFIADTGSSRLVEVTRSAPPSLSFAATTQGVVSIDSPRTVTVQNIGNSPLIFSSLKYPADFPEDASGTANDCNASTTLAPGSTCTVTVDFNPAGANYGTSPLLLNEQVLLTTNALNAVAGVSAIAVSGNETATQPVASLVLAASNQTPPAGGPITLSATTSGTGPTPTGFVSFYANGALFAVSPLINGTAVLNSLGVTGVTTYQAVYGGDSVYLGVSSNLVVVQPTRSSTLIELNSNNNPAQATTSITFTVGMKTTIRNTPPTGTVSFYDGGMLLGTSPVVANVATLSISTLTAGVHPITAIYNGDSNYAPANSNTLKQVVALAKSAIQLNRSNWHITVGDTETLTGTVTGAGPTPTGTVAFFYDGSNPLGTATLVGGVATLNTVALSGGTHQLRAEYHGSNYYQAASSGFKYVRVDKGNAVAVLVSSLNPAPLRTPVTFTVTVTGVPGGPVPTGTVFFNATGLVQGSSVLIHGKATYSVPSLQPGIYHMLVIYIGDGSYYTIRSNVVVEVATQ